MIYTLIEVQFIQINNLLITFYFYIESLSYHFNNILC